MIPPRVVIPPLSPFSPASSEEPYEDVTPDSSDSETPLFDDTLTPSSPPFPSPPLPVSEPAPPVEAETSLRRELDVTTGRVIESRSSSEEMRAERDAVRSEGRVIPEHTWDRLREIEATGLRWVRELPSGSDDRLPRSEVELIMETMMTMVRGYLRSFDG